MEVKNIILSEVTQSQKDVHSMYVPTCKWILAENAGTTLHSTDPNKLSKNKGPNKEASISLRRENK